MVSYGIVVNTEVVRIIETYNFSSGIILIQVELRPTKVWQVRLTLMPDEIRPGGKDGSEEASKWLWMEK